MIIKRKSIFSGNVSERDLPITQEQINRWERGDLIQEVMPNLSASDREFILTGMTDEEWNTLYDEEDKEDEEAFYMLEDDVFDFIDSLSDK